jgi:N-acetylneuraminic acid mutarotase
MKRSLATLTFCLFAISVCGSADSAIDPLPAPVSNNSVAVQRSGKSTMVYSLMGIGAKKTWDSVTNAANVLDLNTGKWSEIKPVPGSAGRIAASAVAARGKVFLLGGYSVDAQGGEITVPDMNVFSPGADLWFRAPDLPLRVDDAVALVYRDRYIYVIGGWSDSAAVRYVQLYDIEKNRWSQATPVPGTPVFAHAGGIVGETIVYVDGAYKNPAPDGPRYIASDQCWMGKIDHRHPERIQWAKLPPHPGSARFRIAAAGSEKDGRIYFSGGSDNPYSFNGIGYDGSPSEPSPVTFAFVLRGQKWETVTDNTSDPVMDARGLVVAPQGLLTIGGMAKGQQVTAKVNLIPANAPHEAQGKKKHKSK